MCYSQTVTVIATHSGKFHADDVFAIAALLLVYTNGARVARTREAAEIERADVVVDVGGISDPSKNRFDHHQVGGAGERPNKIPYAAFGLVWRKFGAELGGSEEVAAYVDDVLVAPVDANDNGVDLFVPKQSMLPYDLPSIVRAFNPTWQESPADLDNAFRESVGFAKRIVEREIARAKAIIGSRQHVKGAYETAGDKRVIVLDEDYSWKDTASKFPEPLFVVHPQNGTWRLYAVRDNPHVFKNRKDLPAEWAGLRDADFVKATGVLDAVFCHRNRFMAVAKTREGALGLAKRALED